MTVTGTARPRWVSEHGDAEAWDAQILRTTVGSEVHGIAIPGTEGRL